MQAQSNAALGTAKLLAGGENITRIDPVVSPGRFKLGDVKEMPSLKGLGNSEARKALPELRKVFLGEPAEQFDAFYK